MMRLLTRGITVLAWLAATPVTGVSQVADTVRFKFADTDLRVVASAMGRFLSKPLIVANLPSVRVSVETPGAVNGATVRGLLAGLAKSHDLLFEEDSLYFRLGPKPAAVPPAQVAPVMASPSRSAVQLFVIRLKHAQAADVAASINQLFGAGGGYSSRGGLSSGTLGDQLRQNTVPPQGVPGEGAAGPALREAALRGETVIVPDALTNSLLLRASREDFEVLRQAVEQLDIRPLQVLVEVLIVEARHDRAFSLGADATLSPQGAFGGTVDASTSGGGVGDLIVRLMKLGRGQVDALIRTSQSRGDVRILSRPVLLASNNQEARFLVGTQRPFVQVSRSLPTDAPQRDQVIQYKDVGTKLAIRPTINQDGYVSLLIQQEISAATAETQFDAPIISTREARTQVLVKDQQTIVIGGLRDLQREQQRSGVPVLSQIPLLGGLFGSTTRRSNLTELYLFITPRIIASDADAEAVTGPRLPADADSR